MQTSGYLLAIISAILWGLVYALDGKILTKTSPTVLLFFHGILSSLILLPFIIHGFTDFKELLTVQKRGTLILIIISIILVTIANYTLLFAIQKIGAPVASAIEIAYPFFVILFSALLFAYRLNGYVILGAVLIFLGSFVIIRYG